MTTKTISTTITAGYSLGAQYSQLDITQTGAIEGYGLRLDNASTIRNDGQITSSGDGVTAYAAVTIINGSDDSRFARITGYSGIFAPDAPAVVSNFATIRGSGGYGDGVFLSAGGSITNGAADDSSAYIFGAFSGIAASAAQVTNFGTIRASRADGVSLATGGSVTNGSLVDPRATIIGQSGVVVGGGAATILNYRTIEGLGTMGYGVALAAGGQVSNGSVGDTTANIYGGFTGVQAQALATLVNYGTVSGSAQDGIFLHSGGAVTNGSPSDVRARIAGGAGGVFAPSGVTTVNNFGAIAAVASGFGVYIDGGKVTNGSTLMTGALIEGTDGGVAAVTASAQVTNFGNIDGIGGGISAGMGVSLKAGGTVINGAEGDTAALIEGQGFGVFSQGLVKIANFGTVEAVNGLYLSGGASVTNGSTTDTSASIDAYRALVIRDGAGTLANFGTILSTGTGSAVALFTQGTVVNGAASDTGALIEGGDLGVLLGAGGGTVTNFGTILADLTSGSATGVYLSAGTLTNGSAKDGAATIFGRYAVLIAAGAPATVTNFGTLHGFGGVALYFEGDGDTLNVEGGSVFEGSVLGGGGMLDLASGTGTLSSLTSGGDVTVAGSMAKTTFQNFDVIEVGAGAAFTDKGAANIGAGHTLATAGTLTLAAAVRNAGLLSVSSGGTLTVSGAVSQTGSVSLDGGTADFAGAFKQDVTFTAQGGVLELGHAQSYSGSIDGFSATTALDFDDIAFSGGTKATFKGKAGSGTLTVTDGTHTAAIKLVGDHRGATFNVIGDGHGGTLVTETAAAAAPHPTSPSTRTLPAIFVAAMAVLDTRAGTGACPQFWRNAETHVLGTPRVANA